MEDSKMYLKKYTIQIWCDDEKSSSLEFATEESHEVTGEIFRVAETIHGEKKMVEDLYLGSSHWGCHADNWVEGWESDHSIRMKQ